MLEIREGKKKIIEYNEVIHLYKLSHLELDMALGRIRERVEKQLEDFKIELMSMVNNLNYLRYMQAYPDDDIRFLFREKINASLVEARLEQKNIILDKMMHFEVIKQDCAGVADNCLWEINQLLQKEHLIDLRLFCPTGVSFLEKNKDISDQYLQFWKNNTSNELNLTTIFKEIAPIFDKEELIKLGSILAQTNKSVVAARLIYRASEHNFQSNFFKEACAGIGNTLLIAKSDKGKIFGGFSPAKWLNTKEKEYVGDATGSSFLFSLSNAQVFPIKKTQLDYAISSYGDWGPIYGSPYGPDLSIADKCHLNDKSCSSLGSHYDVPSNIKEYSNEAFNLLAGAKKFKVLEYEIYELILE